MATIKQIIEGSDKLRQKLTELRDTMDDELMLTPTSERAYEILTELEELFNQR